MTIEVFRLNRQRQKTSTKIVDIGQFVAFIATGHSVKLIRSRGRPTELFDMGWFDWFKEQQKSNDRAVENRSFCYIYQGDGKKISDKMRDEKGRPLKEYIKKEDILGKISKCFYYDNSDIFSYAKEKKILFDEYEYYAMKNQKF